MVHFGINWSFLGLELPAKMSGRKNNGLIIEFDFSKVKNEMKIQNQSNLYLAVSIIFLQRATGLSLVFRKQDHDIDPRVQQLWLEDHG